MVVILQKGHLELVPFVPQLFSLTVYKVAIFLSRTHGVVQPFFVALCYRSFQYKWFGYEFIQSSCK